MIVDEILDGILERLEELKDTPHNASGVFNQVSMVGDADMEDAVKRLYMATGCLVAYTGGDLSAVNLNTGRYLHEANFVVILGVKVHAGARAALTGKSGLPGVTDLVQAVVAKLSNQKLGLDIEGLEFTAINLVGVKQNAMVIGLPLRTVCLIDI